MGSNWENFLKNLGEWRGSFTQLSPSGEILGSTPSILNLEGLENNQLVRFRLRRYANADYSDPPSQDYSQEYRSLGRQIIFFDTGAFSKGSLQLAPFAEFGAEFGFVHQDRRLRFVQLFDKDLKLNSLTLIREFRTGSQALERPPLTIDQLVGTWQGTACTAYPDLRPPEILSTSLTITQTGDRLEQTLSFGGQALHSTAQIEGQRLLFSPPNQPRQILLLPDGTSCNTPLSLQLRQAFFVEVGWLISPTERQRLIRSYDASGAWVNATLVTETKVA
jgi:hypothetical protein